MIRPVLVLTAVVLAACGGTKREQSLADAMKLFCTGDAEAGLDDVNPAERPAARTTWLLSRVTNREVRSAIDKIGNVAPAERSRLLAELVARAGLTTCAALETGVGGAIGDGVRLPELPAGSAGVIPLDQTSDRFTVVVRRDQIIVLGEALVQLQDGVVHPSDLQGRPHRIARLEAFTKQVVDLGRSEVDRGGSELTGVLLVIQPDVPFETLFQVVMSIKPSGIAHYHLLARRAGVRVAVPIELPAATPDAAGVVAAGTPAPIGMIVAMTTTNLLVFSISGAEGTINAPALTTAGIRTDDIARVQAALIDIKRRHSDETRIVVMFDPTISVQLVTETIAAVRATPDGARLFPDVVLSAGFE